jgi:lysophospholipase L1-like esterase
MSLRSAAIKSLAVIMIVLIVLLAAEGMGQMLYRIKNHYWLFSQQDTPYVELFRKHPFLVAEARPDAAYVSKGGVRLRHNHIGARGDDVKAAKSPGTKRILVLGGSSAYCVGVSNKETWPRYLQEKLGKGHEVINLGVPGYTTAEHIVQTALQISDLSPDVVIYYLGWNDARNQHVAGLKSDYSDFHGRSQYNHLMLGAFKFGNRSMLVQTVANTLRKIFVRDPEGIYKTEGTSDKFTAKIDVRALDIYKRNLHLLISLCRTQGVRAIMVPQIMNYEKLTGDKPYGWLPYVKDKDLKVVMEGYNKAMNEVCAADKADYMDAVLGVRYSQQDFFDNLGHFSAHGNERFAEVLARYLTERP